MERLSDKELRVLDYLKECLSDGIPPSVREICKATSIKSTSTVHACLKKLEESGHIHKKDGLNRSIQLAEGHMSTVAASRIPLVGQVTAGNPILATEEVEEYIAYGNHSYSSEDLFALRIKGDSMINAGILNGDIVVVKKSPTARNGEIVVALIEDEATVKRFYKENGHFRLQPENDNYQPIIVPECSILGKVVSLLRYY